jgi:hypothetical protein
MQLKPPLECLFTPIQAVGKTHTAASSRTVPRPLAWTPVSVLTAEWEPELLRIHGQWLAALLVARCE